MRLVDIGLAAIARPSSSPGLEPALYVVAALALGAMAVLGSDDQPLEPIKWWYSLESERPPKWIAAATREEAIAMGRQQNPNEGFYILPQLPAAADIAEAERRLATGEEPMPEYIEALL